MLRREVSNWIVIGFVCFLAVVIYVICGLVIALPYTLLASGNVYNLLLTALVSPLAVCMLALLALVLKRNRKPGQWVGVTDYLFLGSLVYLLLPILLNGTSLLLAHFGYHWVAAKVFAIRYVSLVLVAGLLLLFGGMIYYGMRWFVGRLCASLINKQEFAP